MLADAGFHVIAVDLLGFGYSEKPTWFDYSIQAQARMVSQFMHRLGIGKAIVVASLPGVGEAITPFLIDSKTFLRFRMQGTLAKANHHLITNDRIESIRRPLSAADGHHSVLATSRNWHANRLEQDANLIDQQTLIIWGEEDTVIPIRNGYKLHEEILNSRFVILKDCGHVPQEEKSEIFVEQVSEFCHDKKGQIAAKEGDEMRIEG